MTGLRLYRRRTTAAAAERQVKALELDILKQQPEALYGGYISDGALIPDLAPRYEQWFDGYTPKSLVAAYYSAPLKRYYALQTGGLMEKGEGDDCFVFLCEPLSPAPFFYDEYDGENYRLVMRNSAEGRFITPYYYSDFTPQTALSMAVRHHHRLFGVDYGDALVIRWSGADGSEDWSDGINGSGYVRLGGALGDILQLVSFGSKVVIIRERGISALTALGAPENFKINDIALPASPITAGTAAVCGGKLYFHTKSGIMCFDGDGVEAAEAPFQSRISAPVCAAGRGEKYLLGCGGEVYCYDTSRGCGYFIDCPAELFLNGGSLLAFGSGEVHIIDGAEPSARLETQKITFDRKGKKTVTGLYIACGGSCQVGIASESASRTFTGSGYFRVGVSGERFTVTVTADALVTEAKLYAEVYDGV